jgi:hypothetical protein
MAAADGVAVQTLLSVCLYGESPLKYTARRLNGSAAHGEGDGVPGCYIDGAGV